MANVSAAKGMASLANSIAVLPLVSCRKRERMFELRAAASGRAVLLTASNTHFEPLPISIGIGKDNIQNTFRSGLDVCSKLRAALYRKLTTGERQPQELILTGRRSERRTTVQLRS